jgi:hypothetical protein
MHEAMGAGRRGPEMIGKLRTPKSTDAVLDF